MYQCQARRLLRALEIRDGIVANEFRSLSTENALDVVIKTDLRLFQKVDGSEEERPYSQISMLLYLLPTCISSVVTVSISSFHWGTWARMSAAVTTYFYC